MIRVFSLDIFVFSLRCVDIFTPSDGYYSGYLAFFISITTYNPRVASSREISSFRPASSKQTVRNHLWGRLRTHPTHILLLASSFNISATSPTVPTYIFLVFCAKRTSSLRDHSRAPAKENGRERGAFFGVGFRARVFAFSFCERILASRAQSLRDRAGREFFFSSSPKSVQRSTFTEPPYTHGNMAVRSPYFLTDDWPLFCYFSKTQYSMNKKSAHFRRFSTFRLHI